MELEAGAKKKTPLAAAEPLSSRAAAAKSNDAPTRSRRSHLNLAYRWFCRLGFDDEVPDHSTFCRKMLVGLEGFEPATRAL